MVNNIHKNLLLQGKTILYKQYYFLIILLVSNLSVFYSQVNYVSNPSFEYLISPPPPNFVTKIQFWNALDTTKLGAAGLYYNAPNTPVGYCLARTGTNFIRQTLHCTPGTCQYNNSRQYPRNRLKSVLMAGTQYCVKMYVSLQDVCPMAIDALQIYFGDISLDTIKYCNSPLTYLSPQISNTLGIVGDTSNWVEIKNTFTASGNEKYLVIGCFITDAAITRTATGVASGDWSEYFIDDVSVIDFNLPAFAGPDKNINLGDSAFIGRPPEIGLECTWATGTTTIGTGGGLWVKPTGTGTFSYVVTQNICGNIKTDTVNVNVSPGLVSENELFANSVSVYPQPAKDVVTISLSNYYESSIEIKIYDLNGRLIKSEEGIVKNGQVTFNTTELNNAVYSLQFINHTGQIANKRLVIAR